MEAVESFEMEDWGEAKLGVSADGSCSGLSTRCLGGRLLDG